MTSQPTLGVAPGLEVKLSSEQLHDFERDIFQKTFTSNDGYDDYIEIKDLNYILKKYFNI